MCRCDSMGAPWGATPYEVALSVFWACKLQVQVLVRQMQVPAGHSWCLLLAAPRAQAVSPPCCHPGIPPASPPAPSLPCSMTLGITAHLCAIPSPSLCPALQVSPSVLVPSSVLFPLFVHPKCKQSQDHCFLGNAEVLWLSLVGV